MGKWISIVLGLSMVWHASVAEAATSSSRGPVEVLRFRGAAGWSAPSVRVSEDKRVLSLGFRQTPARLKEAIEGLISERARRVFPHYVVRQDERRVWLDLHLPRALKGYKRKTYMGKENWLVRVELDPFGEHALASHESLFPEGLERIVVRVTESTIREQDADCGGVEVLRNPSAAWSDAMELLYGTCLQASGKHRAARKAMEALIQNAGKTSAMGVLAALRLNSWEHQDAVSLSIPEFRWTALPAPVAQELGLRLAQKTYTRNLNEGIRYFLSGFDAGDVQPFLVEDAQRIRFDLLSRAAAEKRWQDVLALAESLDTTGLPEAESMGIRRALEMARMHWVPEAAENAKSPVDGVGTLPTGDVEKPEELAQVLRDVRGSEMASHGQNNLTATNLTDPFNNLAVVLGESLESLKKEAAETANVENNTARFERFLSLENNGLMPFEADGPRVPEIELALALQQPHSKRPSSGQR